MLAPFFLAFALLSAPVMAAGSPAVVVQQGKASIYADKFHGRRTASGELHDQNALTAASRLLPLGTLARVINLETGQAVTVEITDRGPYAQGRIIDLSRRAAGRIGLSLRQGVAPVKVEAHVARQPTPELREEVARLAAVRAAPKPRDPVARAIKQPNVRRGVRENFGRQ
ncbi:MAG: septal ring lytic transglycosylase RlpA family protein [Rhodospirillaceae bacterium]